MALFPGDMNIGWGFGIYPDHCTGSPTCQCSDCRLTEWNSGQPPEDQLPHGYKYEPPEVKANREVGLYATGEPREKQETEEVYNGFQYVDAPIEEEESLPTDPMLAVSELEVRVEMLEGMLKTYFDEAPSKRIRDLEETVSGLSLVVTNQTQRITDLEERLGNLTLVVNVLIEQVHRVVHDEGRIDGHKAILTSLVGKVATLENHVEYLRTGKEKE